MTNECENAHRVWWMSWLRSACPVPGTLTATCPSWGVGTHHRALASIPTLPVHPPGEEQTREKVNTTKDALCGTEVKVNQPPATVTSSFAGRKNMVKTCAHAAKYRVFLPIWRNIKTSWKVHINKTTAPDFSLLFQSASLLKLHTQTPRLIIVKVLGNGFHQAYIG